MRRAQVRFGNADADVTHGGCNSLREHREALLDRVRAPVGHHFHADGRHLQRDEKIALAHVEAARALDEALKQLDAGFPADFAPLVADRRGDVYTLQSKKDQARAEYTKAWQGLGERDDYRRMVEVKLTALGVDPKSLAPAAKPAAGSAKS